VAARWRPKSFIAEHPDLVRAYVASISEAADWANAHPAEVIKLGLDKDRLDPQYLPELYAKDGSKGLHGVALGRSWAQ